jgi:hypothetical protein
MIKDMKMFFIIADENGRPIFWPGPTARNLTIKYKPHMSRFDKKRSMAPKAIQRRSLLNQNKASYAL